MLEKLYKLFSNDIGIDLGTATTLVYLKGHGIVIQEPSIVAINTKSGRVVAVGGEAKKMLGRTPGHIRAVRPLVDGVISDFEVTEEMIAYFIRNAEKLSKKFFRPRVVVGVPSGITNVEHRAVYDAARSAGAREVHIVEEPMAAAIGIRLPVHEPVGSMVIDIGGGTTDIAVISLGGIVRSKNLKAAGDRMNSDISLYIRNEFKVLVGEKTAETVKMELGNAFPDEPRELAVKGRDLLSGLPREIIITDADIRDALAPAVAEIIEGAKEVLETTPPEILGDIMQRGMYLTGGGALLRGLAALLRTELKLPVYVADDPISAVARGAGVILEDLIKYEDVLVHDYDIRTDA